MTTGRRRRHWTRAGAPARTWTIVGHWLQRAERDVRSGRCLLTTTTARTDCLHTSPAPLHCALLHGGLVTVSTAAKISAALRSIQHAVCNARRKYSYHKNINKILLLLWRAPRWSVAVLTIRRQSVRSLAFLQAEWIPMLTDRTSPFAVSQLVQGRPQGLLQ